jgi:hypothetical protein
MSQLLARRLLKAGKLSLKLDEKNREAVTSHKVDHIYPYLPDDRDIGGFPQRSRPALRTKAFAV